MMNAGMLKMMIGNQLGDPTLQGFAPGKGLAVVALDYTNIFAVIELKEEQYPLYTKQLKGLAFQYTNEVLVVASSPSVLKQGISEIGSVKSTLLSKRTPTLRIDLQPAKAIEQNQETIESFLQSTPNTMAQSMIHAPGATLDSTAATMRMMEGELRLFVAIAKQCDLLELVITPKEGGLRISKTIFAKPNTPFAKLLDAPRVIPSNPRIRAGYLGNDALRLEAEIANPQALLNFLTEEVDKVLKTMDIQDVDAKQLLLSNHKWLDVLGGSFAESFGLGGAAGMEVGILTAISDEAKALKLLEESPEDMQEVLKSFDAMGIPAKIIFEKNARTYKGVQIHQLRMDMSATNFPSEMKDGLAMMRLTNLVYDVAITNGVLGYCMGEKKMDQLIDHLQDSTFQPLPLQARSVFPENGFLYLDLDVAKYIEGIASLLPSDQSASYQPILELLKGAPPLSFSGIKGNHSVSWSLDFPAKLIEKYGQVFLMMQMQQMQQAAPAPIPSQP
jgi:RNA binding exosome subunit